MGSKQNSAAEEVESLRRALNGLRREHRELKEKVEDRVLDYLEEEKDVVEEIDSRVGDIGFLIREIRANRERIEELEEEVGAKAGIEETRSRLEELEERVEEKDEDVVERVKKLETRLDLIAERLD